MHSAVRSKLRVEFLTQDPKLTEILNMISDFPEYTSFRHELEAHLYSSLRSQALQEAIKLKRMELERERRKEQNGNS